MNNLGERIKDLRILNGLSQPQLAKLVGVSNATISFWENDINEPKASYIKKLCEIFQVTPEFLLDIKSHAHNNPPT